MPDYTDIPSVSQLRRDITGSGPTIGQHRAFQLGGHRRDADSDRILDLIYGLVDSYGKTPQTRTLKIMDILGQLYIITRAWLKRTDKSLKERPGVEALSRVVDAKLCHLFNCSPAGLREALKTQFGKALDEGMGDAPGSVVSLTHDELQKYKLEFRGGLAYMWDWHNNPGRMQRVPANSANAANLEVMTAGYAGYVLGLGYSFYMARHEEKTHNNVTTGHGFTHGVYKTGRRVLAAGEIAIVDGRVRCITNSSGHYKPREDKMVHAIRALIMNGVSLHRLAVGIDNGRECRFYDAQQFLDRDGELARLTPYSTREEGILALSIPGWLSGTVLKNNRWGDQATEADIVSQLFPGMFDR